MDWDFLALLIPLAPFIIGGLAIWTHHQRKMLDKQSEISAEKAAQYSAQNQRLEQRVAVLERILTDRSTKLAEEIEDLRDRPLDS